MRARNISTRLCTTRVGSRRSGNTRANLSAKPRRRSAIARSITPPFEVRRPPSKAAVTFLARTAGNENGRIVSSVMAGVAFAVEGDGVGFATESYAASALYTTLASLSAALWRIRRVRWLPIGILLAITGQLSIINSDVIIYWAENVSAALGIDASAPRYRSLENVVVAPVVI